MADRRIQDLDAATSVQPNDLFVLSQSNAAKKLTGAVLEQWLLQLADGHGGISSIAKTQTVGLVDTYTITYADNTTSTFTVNNGKGVTSITKTSTSGLVDTYTIAYNDGSASSFTVTNGAKGDDGSPWYVWVKWTSTSTPTPADLSDNPDKYMGICSTSQYSTAPTNPALYKWYLIKGEKGDEGSGITSIIKTSTSGLVDTYTITLDDGTTQTFNVTNGANGTNGSNISTIAKTGTVGLVDTYTVTLSNGNTTNFNVTNGNSIASITLTAGSHQAGTFDEYTITYLDGTTSSFEVYNGANGEGTVSSVNGIQSVGSDVTTMVVRTTDPTTSTVGATNLLWVNRTSGSIFVCIGSSAGVYTWVKLSDGGYTVDLELDSSTYELVAKLYDSNGTLVSTSSVVDLPLETMVVGGSYNAQSKKIILTLKNGNTIEIPVSGLISGLATCTDYTGSLTTTWTGSSAPYTQAVSVNGILATDKPMLDIVPSGTYATDTQMQTDWSKIYRVVSSANTLTFYASEVPTGAISFIARVIR